MNQYIIIVPLDRLDGGIIQKNQIYEHSVQGSTTKYSYFWEQTA